MSGMTLGSMIEADRRLRAHEVTVRRQNKVARDAEVWRRYEAEFEARGVPGVGSEAEARQVSESESDPQGGPAAEETRPRKRGGRTSG